MKWLAALLLALTTPALAAERSFTIASEAFSQEDIIDARAQPDISGMAVILLTFSDAASPRVAALTQAWLNQDAPVVLDGKTLVTPRVVEAVAGNTFQITGNFTLAEAEALALAISGKPPLPDSLDE